MTLLSSVPSVPSVWSVWSVPSVPSVSSALLIFFFVCCGGGGMLAGIASYVKSVRPEVHIIGVEAEDAAGMTESLRQGEVTELDSVGEFLISCFCYHQIFLLSILHIILFHGSFFFFFTNTEKVSS